MNFFFGGKKTATKQFNKHTISDNKDNKISIYTISRSYEEMFLYHVTGYVEVFPFSSAFRFMRFR